MPKVCKLPRAILQAELGEGPKWGMKTRSRRTG